MIKEVETYLIDIVTRQNFEKVSLKYDESKLEVSIKSETINQIEVDGADLLDCYRKVQELLEEKGYLLCLNGSRIDVQASGLLRDSTNGISTYQFTEDFTSDKPILNIFHPSDRGYIGTVQEHRDFIANWKIKYKNYLKQQ
ncbi:hypothetical protein [Reichenbachiella sp. MSK19-1]|uniref:hypothetical protein n=1 Tax=Reichenbachiella sp. MSK19-1 TaxID=1897631 RepID=UPI000E6CC8F3|nr:hypothetical protein [Reichenbachiella sp. MSK19-1]RJE71209.1 hypothetical protein BGP76_08640 [Reichenbachiella sp. MSK19-1]